jgi:peptide methionine sulfoxide reductase msrA/msrB
MNETKQLIFLVLLSFFAFSCVKIQKEMKYRKLTPEEEKVIIHKGTEPPFSGVFYHHFEKGTYVCKRCGSPLYKSDAKFDSGCGWPSFDEEIPGSVKKIPDPDGIRTEIVCFNCGAHLGHVFYGEQFTNKNTRHCVNSISLDFIPDNIIGNQERAIFAGGCFWGVEYYFQNLPGVLKTTVGYIGGYFEKPTYEDVCSGNTGHAEAVEIVFNPEQISYDELLKLFFEIHDFTQVNRQGPDIGEQYRTEIFYLTDEQKTKAEEIINQLKSMGYNVATKVTKATHFWEAEEYHQKYYYKKSSSPYCHFRRKIFQN